MDEDVYRTIEGPAEASLRDKGSRFLAYSWPVCDEESIKEHLNALRKRYYDATHHCYAWRLGARGERWRANDDGEPSGSAGQPIMGQLQSSALVNVLIVVVRYFGGTKLGVPGLINAYRESAKAVIGESRIVERTVEVRCRVVFPYGSINGVMRVVKEFEPRVTAQNFDTVCEMELAVRQIKSGAMCEKLRKVDGTVVEPYEE